MLLLIVSTVMASVPLSRVLPIIYRLSDNGYLDSWSVKVHALKPMVKTMLGDPVVVSLYDKYKSSILFDSEEVFIKDWFDRNRAALDVYLIRITPSALLVPITLGERMTQLMTNKIRDLLTVYLRSFTDLCLFDILPRHALLHHSFFFEQTILDVTHGLPASLIGQQREGFEPIGHFTSLDLGPGRMRGISPGIVGRADRIYDVVNKCSVRMKFAISFLPDVKGMVVKHSIGSAAFWGTAGYLALHAGQTSMTIWKSLDGLSLASQSEVAEGYIVYDAQPQAVEVIGRFMRLESGGYEFKSMESVHKASGGFAYGLDRMEYLDFGPAVSIVSIRRSWFASEDPKYTHVVFDATLAKQRLAMVVSCIKDSWQDFKALVGACYREQLNPLNPLALAVTSVAENERHWQHHRYLFMPRMFDRLDCYGSFTDQPVREPRVPMFISVKGL